MGKRNTQWLKKRFTICTIHHMLNSPQFLIQALLILRKALNAESSEDETRGEDQVIPAAKLQRLIELFGDIATRAGMIPATGSAPQAGL